jgi:coronin-1B/1C/6
VTNNDGIHPLSWTVPRKSDAFQDDIFPDCASSNPAHSADKWVAGSSKLPKTMSLNPALASRNGDTSRRMKLKTVASVSKELTEAQTRIKYLEKKLKDAGISY